MINRTQILLVSFLLSAVLFLSSQQFTLDLVDVNLSRFSSAPQQDHKVTIVSAYYAIEGGKKHSVGEYRIWLKNFLSSVELPIVFFCAPEFADIVQELRGEKPIKIITKYATTFKTPPLIRLGGLHWAEAQHFLDPEGPIHVKEVYGSFAVKPWFLRRASRDLNPFNSEYFYWVDAGAFRDSSITHTLSNLGNKLDNIYSVVSPDTLILSTIRPFEDGLDFVTSVQRSNEMDAGDFIQGGFFAIDWFERETIAITIQQSNLNRFAGKEQSVFTHAARLNWKRVYIQNTAYRNQGCGADVWFSFEFWADGEECFIPAWIGPEHWLESS